MHFQIRLAKSAVVSDGLGLADNDVRDKFCIENDPREDKNNYHTVVLEDGEEMEEVSFWSEDIKYFEKSAESFKHQHSPKIEELKKYLDELYEAMRKDLGSNK